MHATRRVRVMHLRAELAGEWLYRLPPSVPIDLGGVGMIHCAGGSSDDREPSLPRSGFFQRPRGFVAQVVFLVGVSVRFHFEFFGALAG